MRGGILARAAVAGQDCSCRNRGVLCRRVLKKFLVKKEPWLGSEDAWPGDGVLGSIFGVASTSSANRQGAAALVQLSQISHGLRQAGLQ